MFCKVKVFILNIQANININSEMSELNVYRPNTESVKWNFNNIQTTNHRVFYVKMYYMYFLDSLLDVEVLYLFAAELIIA